MFIMLEKLPSLFEPSFIYKMKRILTYLTEFSKSQMG